MASTLLWRSVARARPMAAAMANNVGAKSDLTRSDILFRTVAPGLILMPPLFTQTRTVTKAKSTRLRKRKERAEREKRGILPNKPQMYISKDSPITNAISREDRAKESAEYDKNAAEEMRRRIQSQGELLRFKFTGVEMSDRVRKLFDLTNGNQKEIIKAQKQRGMELFQRREGDTGSSAVQSKSAFTL